MNKQTMRLLVISLVLLLGLGVATAALAGGEAIDPPPNQYTFYAPDAAGVLKQAHDFSLGCHCAVTDMRYRVLLTEQSSLTLYVEWLP